MKIRKLLMIVLALTIIAGVLSSCTTSADEINVTLKITAGGDEILDAPIKLSYKDPTVMMLVQEAAILFELKITTNDAGDSVKDIEEYKEHKDDKDIDYFWEYKINGQLPENTTGGKANAQVIKDGDVIEYIYSTFDPATIKK